MSAIAEAIDAGTLPGRVWMYANYHCNLARIATTGEPGPLTEDDHAPFRVLGVPAHSRSPTW